MNAVSRKRLQITDFQNQPKVYGNFSPGYTVRKFMLIFAFQRRTVQIQQRSIFHTPYWSSMPCIVHFVEVVQGSGKEGVGVEN